MVGRQSGFSLLELIAVILLIGLALGMVSLSVRSTSPQDEVIDAIEYFLGLAEFASERAILAGESTALYLEPPYWQVQRGQSVADVGWRYRWLTSSNEGWQEIPGMPVTVLPVSMRLRVVIEGFNWNYEDQLDRTLPIAAFDTAGDITPIVIEWTDARERGLSQHIEVDETGVLVWREAPQPIKGQRHGF